MKKDTPDTPQTPLSPQPSPKPAGVEPYKGEQKHYPPAPEGFEEWEEHTGLPPTAVFEESGDFVAGHYRGMDPSVGPNKSRMYYLALHPTKEIIGVWGATALDKRMDMAAPNPGDAVMIQYLGEEATERGQNPVKVYRVRVKRKVAPAPGR